MKLIGQGTYGTVVKGYCLKTKKFVAIKRIADFDDWEYCMGQVIREVGLMKELNAREGGCNFVPQVYDVLVHEQPKETQSGPKGKLTVFIVMEHFDTDLN